ncbi:hypothetical protein [Hyalangium minutum]|uniref:Uncharacterized protein n=1 Tax=Hyalangium minutum TaxID=394096 RepID=A0A085WW69_9BACT|nr:hypothetical protein [Hyalangium minutum]KFE71932.1 hypothetical protein DB31_0193 [Hyalangium minutum]
MDDEVVRWLEENVAATPEQFMRKLRDIYSRKEMLERFPHGF